MKGGKAPLGYTIVEVMVVLAVSGVMFLVAMQFVNGRQARAGFTQGSNDLTNKIQSVAGQVTDGQFTDINLRKCKVSSAGVSFNPGPSTTAQGTNLECVFLGKLLYFHVNATTNPQQYAVFNIAGAFKDPSTHQPVTDLGTGTLTAVIPGLTTEQQIPQSLEISQMRILPLGAADVDTNKVDNFSLGFIQGLGAASNLATDNAATFVSGSQVTSIIYSPNLDNNNYADGDVKATGNLSYASQAEICLVDGTHRAIITINVERDGLNTDLRNLANGGAPCW
jgi:prepilin-type N-terminal cleavage/methylation domain-containing protein